MLTANGLLWANWMDMSWVDGRGIQSWFGVWVSCVSQVSSKSREFTRFAIFSAIVLHLSGTFSPPKVSLSDMNTYNVPFRLI